MRTLENEFKWKPGCDFLPEFDISYGSTQLETLKETETCRTYDGEHFIQGCFHNGFSL